MIAFLFNSNVRMGNIDMSAMSELHYMIMEKIEDGEAWDEIAYELTCEYPFDYGKAYEMVVAVASNMDEAADI